MDPTDPRDLKKLSTAVEESRNDLAPFREERVEFIRQFVGSHYSENGSGERVPIDLLEQAISTYTRQLSANAPQGTVSTKQRQLRAAALLLQMAINHLLDEIDFQKTIENVVQDAMFGIGIIQVGISDEDDSEEVYGPHHDYAQPYADPISLDKWVHDTTATCMEQAEFMGHRYRVPWESVKDNDAFKDIRGDGDDDEQGISTQLRRYNEDGGELASTIGGQKEGQREQLRKYVDLYDIYLPYEQQLVTYAVDEGGTLLVDTPLNVIDWEGPEDGPYRFLTFTDVPDNIMPVSPASLLYDLHDLANMIFRKIGRRADRNKVVGVATNGDEKDAERIRDAGDGEIVHARASAVEEMVFGRQDPTLSALFIQTEQLFSKSAGNLDALAGLSQQGDTLGQEELISTSASVRMQHMRDRVIQFVTKVIRDLAWHLWEDPLIDIPLVKRVPGTDVEVPVRFSDASKEGDFLDYNFTIVPYSMTYLDPNQKAQRLMKLFGVMAQSQQGMMQQGLMPNYQEFFSSLQQLLQLEEFQDLVISMKPQQGDGETPMVGEMPQKAMDAQQQQGPRETIRRNVPGASEQGKADVMMRTLMGGNPQPAEMASLARPTSPPRM